MNSARLVRLAFVVAAAAGVCGCPPRPVRPAPPPLDVVDAGPGNRPYNAGTPLERRRIAEAVAALETATEAELLAAGRRVLAHGETAIPALLDALAHPSERTRGQAAYLLGAAKDRRTIPALAAAATSDPAPPVRYEAAGALLEMGESSGFPPLFDGLAHPDPRVRSKCIEVLAEKTGKRFGYAADASPDDRAAAIRRWRTWLAQRSAAGDGR